MEMGKCPGVVANTDGSIANVECELNGTTAATCSGYSSYKSDYSNGLHTGPTELEWTSTLRGSEVEWGSLTLAEKPTRTSEPLGVTITTDSSIFESSEDLYYVPEPTDEPDAGCRTHIQGWSFATIIVGLLYAFL